MMLQLLLILLLSLTFYQSIMMVVVCVRDGAEDGH